MPRYLVTQSWQCFPNISSEKSEWAKAQSCWIKLHPDDAARWLSGKLRLNADAVGLCAARHGFELNMPEHIVAADDDVVTSVIDLSAQYLDVAPALKPKACHQLRDKDMFEQLLAQA